MRRILALALLGVPLAAGAAHAQTNEPATGRQYVVPVAPGGGTSNPTTQTIPSSITQVPLDASSIVTGGTAVTALTAGHAVHGGWIYNPESATEKLCISQSGTAGSSSGGNTACILPGGMFQLVPSAAAVSVNAATTGHSFAGMGSD